MSESKIVSKQPIILRLFWFAVGGALSVALNIGPFHWMRTHGHLPDWAALAISLMCVTVIFSIWNYHVNFRTNRRWHECQLRYLGALGICTALTYTIALSGIKHWGSANWAAYTIVAVVQTGVSGIKFLLYHYWVYPHDTE